jgi:hypothetical protein
VSQFFFFLFFDETAPIQSTFKVEPGRGVTVSGAEAVLAKL